MMYPLYRGGRDLKNAHMRNEGICYKIFMVFNYLFMIFIVLITLFPYLNVLAKSFNDSTDSLRGGITFYPRVFTLENFKLLINDTAMYKATVVTIVRVVLQVSLSLIIQFMAGYALSRKNVWGLKYINTFFLIPMFISGGLIPQYILFSKLHLLNNFWVYILPSLFSFYNVMIIRSYISSSIPDAVIEAAHLDGCREMRLLFTIIMPLSKPILATIALWISVAAWNDWTTTLYYIQSPELHTLQYKLMQTIKETERLTALIQTAVQSGENVSELQNAIQVTPESAQAAQVIIVTLPIICIYPFLQKYFVKGVMIGSVKG